jgi:hypothetical protein
MRWSGKNTKRLQKAVWVPCRPLRPANCDDEGDYNGTFPTVCSVLYAHCPSEFVSRDTLKILSSLFIRSNDQDVLLKQSISNVMIKHLLAFPNRRVHQAYLKQRTVSSIISLRINESHNSVSESQMHVCWNGNNAFPLVRTLFKTRIPVLGEPQQSSRLSLANYGRPTGGMK